MYSAKRLPVHTGPAAWSAILPDRPASLPLRDAITTDFAIIGAGFAGLSAARRLTQLNPGARIVVLDAGAVGEGAAGRNSGFMIDLPHDLTSEDYAGSDNTGERDLIALNRAAIDFAREAVDEYSIKPDFFDPVGKINGAATARGHAANLSYAAHLEGLNEAHEVLDAQAMQETTGSSYYTSGLYTPGTVMLQPSGYVRGLAEGLRDAVALHENTPALSLERKGADWTVQTPQGSVTAGAVVLANNGHLESFGFAKRRLMHVFLFATMTDDLSGENLRKLGGQPRWGITPSDPMGTTVRRIDSGQGGNRIVTRTCAHFQPSMQTSRRQLNRATRVMRQKFDARFPQLSQISMQYAWAGHLCLSRNGVSVVGRLDDGIFAACCQNGLGTARGTLTGMAAAEIASGTSSALTTHFTRADPPTRLPPAPLSTVGANVVLRWKEHQARQE